MKTNNNLLFLLLTFYLIVSMSLKAQQVQVAAILRDGNIITGSANLSKVQLVTEYGKLEIPAKNVSVIEMGISEDNSKDKIISIVKQLANSNEEMRKNSYDELIKKEVTAIPVISDYIYSDKYEPSTFSDYTAEGALSELKSTYNIKNDFSSKDVVTVDFAYTMGGICDIKKIDIKTGYGTLSIPKSKIERLEILYVNTGDNSERVFKLIPSKHLGYGGNYEQDKDQWLNTGIMVKSGQKITVIATGEITTSSTTYKPNGTTTYEGDYDYGSSSNYPTYGNVIYKIGKSDDMHKAGSFITAKKSGVLFLSIYGDYYYKSSAEGSYFVKVSIK